MERHFVPMCMWYDEYDDREEKKVFEVSATHKSCDNITAQTKHIYLLFILFLYLLLFIYNFLRIVC